MEQISLNNFMTRLKIFYWNIRGIGNLDSRLVFSKLCFLYKPGLMFIAKPWITIDNLPNNFLSRLNLKAFAVNDRNSLSPNL